MGDGRLPLGFSFSCPKRKRKGPAVPMRRPPAGAAAPDPKMRPPDDGLFTGLGAGEQGMDLKPLPASCCYWQAMGWPRLSRTDFKKFSLLRPPRA